VLREGRSLRPTDTSMGAQTGTVELPEIWAISTSGPYRSFVARGCSARLVWTRNEAKSYSRQRAAHRVHKPPRLPLARAIRLVSRHPWPPQPSPPRPPSRSLAARSTPGARLSGGGIAPSGPSPPPPPPRIPLCQVKRRWRATRGGRCSWRGPRLPRRLSLGLLRRHVSCSSSHRSLLE
jgi:hypothetical protein